MRSHSEVRASEPPRATADVAPESKLPLGSLTALVVGSMIGGGIFSLPSQMASNAASGPLLIGWLITGIGMLMLAFVFQNLASRKPDVDGGVYGYARAGFGNYIGFTSAWGYWISAWIGNIGYFVLLMSTLGYFFPIFEGGVSWPSIIVASILLWALHFLVLHGVRSAAFMNTVVTIAKVVPLITFVLILIFAFKANLFTADFWGKVTQIEGASLGSTMDQVKNMMLITVWVFIGIEGASIYSKRAAKRSDVGRATIFGFVGVLALLLLVNILSYGVMAQGDLAKLSDPSLAGILEHVAGKWGGGFISIGLIISLLGALLSWVMLCAEILHEPATQSVLPRFLAKENRNQAPANAMWLTSICMQAMLIWSHFNGSTYTSLIILASSLILLPYLWSALYQLILAIRGESYDGTAKGRGKDLLIGALAVVYAGWLVYAGGLSYLLIAAIAYLLGTALYVWARTQNGKRVFAPYEWAILAVVIGLAIWGVIGLANGSITT